MEEYLKSLKPEELYLIAFVLYFAISIIFNQVILKRKFNFKQNLISALFGLLFFAIYMIYFAY